MSKSFIQNNAEIKAALKKRFKLLELKQSSVVRDAEERGMKIDKSVLSRYLKDTSGTQLSEEQIVWLCVRWGIPLVFGVGQVVIRTGKDGRKIIVHEVPDFNEEKALNALSKIYPNG